MTETGGRANHEQGFSLPHSGGAQRSSSSSERPNPTKDLVVHR